MLKMSVASFFLGTVYMYGIVVQISISIKILSLTVVCSIFYNKLLHQSNAFSLVAFTTVTLLYHVCLVYICIFTFFEIDYFTEHYIFIVRLYICHFRILKGN